jgi:hypothetical protein
MAVNPNGPDQTAISPFGFTGADTTAYTATAVAAGGRIHSSDLSQFRAIYNSELARRGLDAYSFTNGPNYPKIEASDINEFKSAIDGKSAQFLGNGWTDSRGTATNPAYTYDNGSGGGQYGPPGAYGIDFFTNAPAYALTYGNVAQNTKMYAADINHLLTEINSAAAVCVCNCNYCTCNCNYCTCNCNYACTCNCNYSSDERLKENIKLVDTKEDLNVYSFTYLWDKSKTFVGVMAQELLGTRYASAVGTDTNGYYYVDYSQLPIEFKEV